MHYSTVGCRYYTLLTAVCGAANAQLTVGTLDVIAAVTAI